MSVKLGIMAPTPFSTSGSMGSEGFLVANFCASALASIAVLPPAAASVGLRLVIFC